MIFKEFLKDKVLQMSLLIFGLLTIEIFLMAYPISIFIKIYIPTIILILYLISIFSEFMVKRKFYNNTFSLLDNLDEKYLFTEIIGDSNFYEGKILKDVLEQTNKAMLENVNQYKRLQEDYKEYIELWIHEIKIPIATSKMICENNKSDITKSIDEELDKIEYYIEQALFYARSNSIEKDYYIKKNNLKDIVNECIKKNKTSLIENKISIDIHDIENEVSTDSKWTCFIINQIIQNSIKYRKNDKDSKIEIFSILNKENVILSIKDNGIGISESEIGRAFDKGFTGSNGRLTNKKSTGIGLYLCKKLCDKLGIGIELNSIQNEGTEVRIIFPNSSFVDM